MVVLGGGAVSYGRGTPLQDIQRRLVAALGLLTKTNDPTMQTNLLVRSPLFHF